MKKNDGGHIKQDLMKYYEGHTEKEYCEYLYDMLRNLNIYQDKIVRDLTDRNIYCMRAAISHAYAGNAEEFYHELADFFRGKSGSMKLPITYTEGHVFMMLYELGTSVLNK